MTAWGWLLVAAGVCLVLAMTVPVRERRRNSPGHWFTALFIVTLLSSMTLLATGGSTP